MERMLGDLETHCSTAKATILNIGDGDELLVHIETNKERGIVAHG